MRTFFLLLLLPFFGFAQLSQYVNPFIGTGGHGHTFPGATLPFGMVQLSPDTRIDGSWDGCSGYHYTDSIIYGFSHTHLSGTGVSDYGDIMLMPTMDEPNLDKAQYSSNFAHANEKASAGFYGVKLDKFGIDVKLTASTRVGFHQYTFSKSGQANIILDLNHRDQLLMGEVRVIDPKTIEVYRNSSAWATNQKIYARIEFDRPMKITKVNNNAFAPAKMTDTFFAGSLLAIAFSSEVKKGESIKIKVALSPTGTEGTKKNMSEIKGWDFNKVKTDAEKAWDVQLKKIQIPTTDADKATIFYTALYHTMSQPNIAQDVDGMYRGRDDKLHKAEGFDYYSVFSLWDTFRAAHPLYTLIERKRTADFINTFLAQYEQGGRLPVWELASNETDCMIGYHSVSVMADAMAKGITGFDYEKALKAAKHSAMLDHLGLSAYKKNGFISIDDEHESVSKTLEYAYDDWCIAQMAMRLGKQQDYDYFMKRSQNWKNLFDPETKHMRPKKNGGWDKPFDAREVNNNFTEGNSWQYSFFVPHDVQGLIDAHGGTVPFEKKLDEMFLAVSETTGREQFDITGLIGQYAHGNEPSHHMVYLYNYTNDGIEKREKYVQFILNEFYKNTPDGLIGNEDCGQMSAWYVLSSLGIYPQCPGRPEWFTTAPIFDPVTVDFGDGNVGVLDKKVAGDRTFFGFRDNNSELPDWKTNLLIPVPVIAAASRSFKDKLQIKIYSALLDKRLEKKDYIIKYRLKSPQLKNVDFVSDADFSISESATVDAFLADAKSGKAVSDTVSATFVKKPNDYKIAIKSKYNPQYHAGGPNGLLDGISGSENWRKGDWQCYQGQDFEAVIDLQKPRDISSVSSRFLQDSRAWIVMPTAVSIFVSDDNSNFRLVKTVENTLDVKNFDVQIKEFTCDIKTKARYIKVVAKNFGKLPEWHQGAGGDAFIFIDEITVK